ncbi:MAG: 50S ribosome-binding GTPase [Firmicutes bacterium]|nr:50S ribosome-binding GTPase [Bacillota bacterium]
MEAAPNLQPGGIVIALAGNPNSGKTSIFNNLTGARQHVGNWPGVTVEKKEGRLIYDGISHQVVDLPGTYSLRTTSPDEAVAKDVAVDKLGIPHKPIPADKESEWLDKCLNAVFQALPQAEQIRESPDIVYSTENDLLVDLD